MNMGLPAPYPSHEAVVLPDWIDRNGHLNLAYYIVIFDQATDALFEELGIGSRFTAETGTSLFIVETHTTYERELKLGERVRVETTVLGGDAKRLHFAHEMFRADGARAAAHDLMAVHVDMGTRRSAAFNAQSRAAIDAAVAAHADLPRPSIVGRRIALPTK
jgi:acyl-CoA thioester hydrolase